MNFSEFYENFQYIFGEDISSEDADKAFKMASKYEIAVLSDKDLFAIMKDEDEIVGALWTAWSSEEFSFDIVVNEKYQGQGVGKKLADIAIDTYRQDKEAYGEDAIMRAYVVNNKMKDILLKKGFKIESELPGQIIMTME